jgi:cyclopropane fatty-acyl-phospholipid synthase-like methyltransferase
VFRFSGRHAGVARAAETGVRRSFMREGVFGQDYARTFATWRNNFRAECFAKSEMAITGTNVALAGGVN